MFRSLAAFSIILLFSVIIGCSSGNAVSPTVDDSFEFPNKMISDTDSEAESHNLLGTWNMEFDFNSSTVSITQDRATSIHYNVTSRIPAPLIEINSYDPVTEIVDVDVMIHNPFMIEPFDVRLIIYTDSVGHMLENRDGWTAPYDIPGGMEINPFVAYCKDEDDRIFRGLAWHNENLQILCPGGNPSVQFAIEASFPGNCEEPYSIELYSQHVIYSEPGSTAYIEMLLLDWQYDTEEAYVYCQALSSSSFELTEYAGWAIWQAEIINSAGAPAGEYQAFVMAESGGVAMYNDVTITVTDGAPQFNPHVVGTVEMFYNPQDIALLDGIACIAEDDEMVKIMDFSNPLDPVTLGLIEGAGQCQNVAMDENYVYLNYIGDSTMKIYDISNPENPQFMSSVEIYSWPQDIDIQGPYAFATG